MLINSDTKGVANIGPLVIVEDWESSPVLPDSKPLDASGSSLPTTMMAATGENFLGAAAFLTQAELQSSPQGVVVVRQEPTSKLTLWLPGEVQGDLISQFGLPGQDGHSLQEVSSINGNSLTLPIN